jgi:hypothetical protein
MTNSEKCCGKTVHWHRLNWRWFIVAMALFAVWVACMTPLPGIVWWIRSVVGVTAYVAAFFALSKTRR